MYELKMKETDASVIEFIENVDHPQKREDAFRLLDIFTEVTGYEAKMWGPSIIGFGSYHYKYKTGHEGMHPVLAIPHAKQKLACISPQVMSESSYYSTLASTQRGKPACILISLRMWMKTS